MSISFTPIINKLNDFITDTLNKTREEYNKSGQVKLEKVKEFRKEASRLASMANKRVKRLENNDLKDSPAYKGYLQHGGTKFSVKGKTYNELQSEVARMRGFINANTSTVRGCNTYLKEMADNTGIKYKNLTELKEKAPKFFELTSKVEQYLRLVDDMASAIGYQKIWESVNQYTAKNRIDLNDTNKTVDEMVQEVTDAIKEYESPERVDLTKIGYDKDAWFTLPKE